MADDTDESDLEAVEIHDVLSNERRQLILKFLQDGGGEMTVKELAVKIAETESGESPPPSNIRQSAYSSLLQTHLPKLDDMEIVTYDQSAKRVQLKERGREIRIYMETVPRYGITWSEYYVGASSLGLLLIIGAEVGVPLLVDMGSLPIAIFTIILIVVSAVYQTVTQQSSVLHRLSE